MEFTGIIAAAMSTREGTYISLDTNQNVLEDANKLMNKKLSIEIRPYREKRSLDANAYFHVLSGKISENLTISKARSKNILICKYGQPQLLPDGNAMIYKTNAPVEFMLEQESIHCIPVKYLDDAIFYKVYRGSSTYDTKEMSLLIDGTVADAQELGIQTATPEELRVMKERWGV
jgi:hypothetical protein